MIYLGCYYETAKASYRLQDGRACSQQIWRVNNGDWHTKYLQTPFTIDDARDDRHDYGAEAYIRELKGLSYEQAQEIIQHEKKGGFTHE